VTQEYDPTTATARDYYNSADADNFYFEVWGGEDIHVGLYRSEDEPIRDASRRTVEHLATRLDGLDASWHVIDVGAGYGGAARWLVEHHGCSVTCLNLSEAENERNRQMNAERGLGDKITVFDGSFEAIPAEDASFDAAWSQDAILHSGDRMRVLREVDRVLKPSGLFVFTDPMQADDCDPGSLQPIYDRLHLPDLGSPGFYKRAAQDLGWEDLGFEDMTEQLARHYGRVREELHAQAPRLKGKVSDEYLERMSKGLEHWVEGGGAGQLAWGVFLFRKP